MAVDDLNRAFDSYQIGPEVAAGPLAEYIGDELDWVVTALDQRIAHLQRVRDAVFESRMTMDACSPCDKSSDKCAHCAGTGKLDPISRILLT